jgi:2-succinyl-5-enolpyruvyl-6-hydroxy-3-cyclohexene-1-carboxylate synthase
MEHTGSLNTAWAWGLVDGLVASGVGRAVISPGSRSTPVTLACLRHAGMTVHVVLDERTAAFFALGLAKADGRPVAVVCTSGSAVANWHPAVVEADLACVPLILLSADRPAELQGCGANQTMPQFNLFGASLRGLHLLPAAEADCAWLGNLAARAVQQSLWPLAGPVQINMAFREPLLAPTDEAWPVAQGLRPQVLLPRLLPCPDSVRALARRLSGGRGVIVCGAEPMPADAIARLAAAFDVPILADPLSGLRFGPHDRSRVMVHADTALRGNGPAADWVLRFGAFPVSKPVATWLAGCGVEHIVVSGDSRWPDPQRSAAVMIHADMELVALGLAEAVLRPAAPDWVGKFCAAEDHARALIARHAPPEAAVVAGLVDALPDGALLFVGNSMAVRDLDAFSGHSAKRVTVLANRGASGIDGETSTFLGAAASGRYSAAVALLGDLTFLHDIGALASSGLDTVICVLDNGGGGIFDYLPPAALPEFEQAWFTPHHADLTAAAAVWGCDILQADDRNFASVFAMARARPGTTLVRVESDRADSTSRHRALWAAAAQALEFPA